MIAIPDAVSRTSASAKSGREKRRWQARAEALLTQEMSFINNPAFREMDADERWVEEVAAAHRADEDSHPFGTGGQLRMPAHLERLCAARLLRPGGARIVLSNELLQIPRKCSARKRCSQKE